MLEPSNIVQELKNKFPDAVFGDDIIMVDIPVVWVQRDSIRNILNYLKLEIDRPFRMLYDLTAVDERLRNVKPGPERDFTLVYTLLSFERKAFLALKIPLQGEYPTMPTMTDIWLNANWYEREVWDLFGIKFEGHPCLRRILLPPHWIGHPLRKEYPARATEAGPYTQSVEKHMAEERALEFKPHEWGFGEHAESRFMFLNLGPQHPGTHGPFRIVLELDGEEIVDAAPDIGFHHRGAEKMAERQTWHTYIPYTDRVDYLGGVMNNLPYVLTVEKLAGIEVPDRAKMIRIMMSEFFRISNHLVFYGTFSQDIGQMSPVFFMFTDRERVFEIVEAVCGGRMHPSWFRIGGTAQDLPQGWDRLVRDYLDYMPARLDHYERLVMENAIFIARTQGVGAYTTEQAIEWGVTGPGLRATGFAWDFRKEMPYSGYDQLEFDIPVGVNGDCYDRARVHVQEMRQSLRIIRQCLDNMPAGFFKANHPLTTPPPREKTLHDIETLINHFLGVTWGPVIPPGEAMTTVEAVKGATSYYLTSDGSISSYRTRIRTPSFAHVQMIPLMSRGLAVADLIAILGSIDFVLADVDR